MINWVYFPQSSPPDSFVQEVVSAFTPVSDIIDSSKSDLSSDNVLKCVSEGLVKCGFRVEKSKQKIDMITVPVLFGRNGTIKKYFQADAYRQSDGVVIEVEAGRGVLNYQFLKDLFEACMMADVRYLVVAVRNIYKKNRDFETVETFFETLFASNRLKLPLQGILVIGY